MLQIPLIHAYYYYIAHGERFTCSCMVWWIYIHTHIKLNLILDTFWYINKLFIPGRLNNVGIMLKTALSAIAIWHNNYHVTLIYRRSTNVSLYNRVWCYPKARHLQKEFHQKTHKNREWWILGTHFKFTLKQSWFLLFLKLVPASAISFISSVIDFSLYKIGQNRDHNRMRTCMEIDRENCDVFSCCCRFLLTALMICCLPTFPSSHNARNTEFWIYH